MRSMGCVLIKTATMAGVACKLCNHSMTYFAISSAFEALLSSRKKGKGNDCQVGFQRNDLAVVLDVRSKKLANFLGCRTPMFSCSKNHIGKCEESEFNLAISFMSELEHRRTGKTETGVPCLSYAASWAVVDSERGIITYQGKGGTATAARMKARMYEHREIGGLHPICLKVIPAFNLLTVVPVLQGNVGEDLQAAEMNAAGIQKAVPEVPQYMKPVQRPRESTYKERFSLDTAKHSKDRGVDAFIRKHVALSSLQEVTGAAGEHMIAEALEGGDGEIERSIM